MMDKVRSEMKEKQVRVAREIRGIASILNTLADEVAFNHPEDVEDTGTRAARHLTELLEAYAKEMRELEERMAYLESI